MRVGNSAQQKSYINLQKTNLHRTKGIIHKKSTQRLPNELKWITISNSPPNELRKKGIINIKHWKWFQQWNGSKFIGFTPAIVALCIFIFVVCLFSSFVVAFAVEEKLNNFHLNSQAHINHQSTAEALEQYGLWRCSFVNWWTSLKEAMIAIVRAIMLVIECGRGILRRHMTKTNGTGEKKYTKKQQQHQHRILTNLTKFQRYR